jgi:CO dehydrogenase/acetyl-CoA synthase epsilon subunit
MIATKWFAAFNEHNLENLLALYNENAKHFSPKLKIKQPETQGLIIGKAALRNWWHEAFVKIPTLQYIPTSYTANEKRVFMEYIRKVEGEADLLVAEVLEIENNEIIASRVYHG